MNSPDRQRRSLAALFSRLQPWQARLLLLACAALLTFALKTVFSSAFYTVEEQIGSYGWNLSPATRPEQRFSIIEIDERSLQEVGFRSGVAEHQCCNCPSARSAEFAGNDQ